MSHKVSNVLFVLILITVLTLIPRSQPVRAAGPWFVAASGDDNNDCLSPGTPCATINAAILKASAGDTIHVAAGTYTGTGTEVVLIDRDTTLSGGWDAGFTAQDGLSTLDGQDERRGLSVNSGVRATVERFALQHGNVTGNGGGINNAGSLTFLGGILSNNTAGAGNGSAIYNAEGGVMAVGNSFIHHNGSEQQCFTIVNNGIFTLNDSIFEQNTSTSIYCLRLTIMNALGTMTLDNTAVRDNLGGIYSYATLVLNNSSVSGNAGAGGPGGIYSWGGTLIVNNSTISGNSTSTGGGVFAGGDGTVRLNSSTISGNTAMTGGGIYNYPGEPAQIVMQNSILAGNTATEASPDCSGGMESAGYNLVGNTGSCDFVPSQGDVTNVDARLGLLIGSPAYHPLRADSPAVDAGNPAGCTDQDGNPLAADQRGVARAGTCDIGAYEYTAPGSAASLLVYSGDNQQGVTTLPFLFPFQVVAIDGQGSPVSGVTVDFAAPGSGPSGTFASTGTNTTSLGTDADGVATTSIFTANGEAGAYTVSASAAGAGSVTFNLAQILLPPNDPPNDYYAGAVSIPSLPFSATVDTTASGLEAGEPQQCVPMEKTVWYSFTPAADMVVQVDAQGSAITSNINVYRSAGIGLTSLVMMNLCTYYSGDPLTFLAEAGVTYYLQAGGVNGEAGSIQVNVDQVAAPANDSFADAVSISSLPANLSADVTGATSELNEPQNCVAGERTIWYSFAPAETMSVRVDMQGSPGSSNVNVYSSSGPAISDLSFLGCANLAQFTQTFTFLAEAGEIYYLQASGFGGIQLNLQQVFHPGNDDFANAEAIPAVPFSATVDITDVGLEPDEPQNCFGMNKTVWYSFTPAETMLIRADTQGSVIGANINVYEPYGSLISEQSFLGCTLNTGSVIFLAEAGKTYNLQVGNLFGQDGLVQVNLAQAFPPGNDDFAGATVIPGVPFDDTVDTATASIQTGEPLPSCASHDRGIRSVWYAYTPLTDGSVSASIPSAAFTPLLAAYTGSSLEGLTEVGCQTYAGSLVTLQVTAGTTYYFQAQNLYPWEPGGSLQFHLDLPPLPQASFYFDPGAPSRYDTVQFNDSSFDPAFVGISSWDWDFGDGSSATGSNPSHRYATDGEYPVTLTVTTPDGRTASTSQTVPVRTHDVSLLSIQAPRSAQVGQTKAITVSVRNRLYPETVRVDLYRSTPGGEELIGTLTLQVPPSRGDRVTRFTFNYTFTAEDALIGKVSFRAEAVIEGANDAFPQDNIAISSPPTQVK